MTTTQESPPVQVPHVVKGERRARHVLGLADKKDETNVVLFAAAGS